MATNTAAANSTGTNAEGAAEDKYDQAEVSRIISLIRHELSVLSQDTKRKRPLYSKSPQEASARRSAAIKALTEFASHIDALKRK